MPPALRPAPDLEIQKWMNTDKHLTLADLRGKVVVAFAFQMLCPGCVEHSIPQARNIRAFFSDHDVAVIGLHTVFEHHDAMGEAPLKAFLHEYRITFPIGIDRPSPDPDDHLPVTMRRYNMQGTPTIILIDRQGRLRKQTFGHEHDLILGAEIMALMCENDAMQKENNPTPPDEAESKESCSIHGCGK